MNNYDMECRVLSKPTQPTVPQASDHLIERDHPELANAAEAAQTLLRRHPHAHHYKQ